jgi:cytochrome P450
MNLDNIKKFVEKIYRKLNPIKLKKEDIKDPAVELKNYLERTDMYDLKKIEDYEFLQTYGPIHFFPKNNAWLVIGYNEIKQILNDHVTFSAELYEFNLLHDENNLAYKIGSQTIKNLFSKELFENIEILIVEKSKEIIERLSTTSKFDFNHEFSKAIALETMCYILGVNNTMISKNVNYSAFLKKFENIFSNDVEVENNKLIFLFKRLVKLNELSEKDALEIVMIIWHAGTISSEIFISRMMYELIKDEHIVAKIKHNKNLQIKFIEECLRLYPPFLKLTRLTKKEYEISNTIIPNNKLVFLDLFSANRDKTKFEEPNRISLDSNNLKHLGFGHGLFQCIGMGLARRQAFKLLNEILLDLAPTFEIEDVKMNIIDKGLLTEEFETLILKKK